MERVNLSVWCPFSFNIVLFAQHWIIHLLRVVYQHVCLARKEKYDLVITLARFWNDREYFSRRFLFAVHILSVHSIGRSLFYNHRSTEYFYDWNRSIWLGFFRSNARTKSWIRVIVWPLLWHLAAFLFRRENKVARVKTKIEHLLYNLKDAQFWSELFCYQATWLPILI